MANVKITIDREECISCESCWTICPEVFEQSSLDEFSQIVEKYRVASDLAQGDAPEDLRDKVQEAADSCPVEIIHVV
ncbi:MAG: ferredoxin [Candidatus Sulfobium sp.]